MKKYFAKEGSDYDDKLVITFNYKEGTKTITFADLQDAINNNTGSDLDCCGAPRRNEFCSFRFFMGNALPVFAPVCRYGVRRPDVKVLGLACFLQIDSQNIVQMLTKQLDNHRINLYSHFDKS